MILADALDGLAFVGMVASVAVLAALTPIVLLVGHLVAKLFHLDRKRTARFAAAAFYLLVAIAMFASRETEAGALGVILLLVALGFLYAAVMASPVTSSTTKSSP